MTIIIGLLGPAGSGKSTVANYLIEKYGAKRYSLAAPLKEIAKRTLGFSDEQLYGTQEQKEANDPRYNFSCRWFLQKLGTEGCRTVLGEDVWTKACLEQIRNEKPKIAVIDDVRFKNEAYLIHKSEYIEGWVLRLLPPLDEEAATRAAGAGTHASEAEWREAHADYKIEPKQRGIPELLALVDDKMKEIL